MILLHVYTRFNETMWKNKKELQRVETALRDCKSWPSKINKRSACTCMCVYICEKVLVRVQQDEKWRRYEKKKRENVLFFAANEKKKHPRKSCESKIYRKTEKLTKI